MSLIIQENVKHSHLENVQNGSWVKGEDFRIYDLT